LELVDSAVKKSSLQDVTNPAVTIAINKILIVFI